jgi:flagellar hook-basal body complex protein FliE
MTNAVPGISASGAIKAYLSVDSGTPPPGSGGGGFSDMLSRALSGAVESGRQADAQSAAAIAGQGDLTHVVTAVSRAELALQTTVAVRDRVIQAYQDIIKMPI